MNLFKRQVGQKGEELATDFLIHLGYQIIERNFRTRFGELDIIAIDGDTLVFVEVKTKSDDTFGSPEEMYTKRKRDQVKYMTQIYLKYKAIHQTTYRIDLITIILENPTSPNIRHYPSIY